MKKKPSNSAFGALPEDLLSAIDHETRLEDNSGILAISSDKKDLIIFFRLRMPLKILPWVIGILLGIIFAAFKLDPAILKQVQQLVSGTY